MQLCFFQASRFDSIASLMAAHQGCVSEVIELDADALEDRLPLEDVLNRLFEADSVQVW